MQSVTQESPVATQQRLRRALPRACIRPLAAAPLAAMLLLVAAPAAHAADRAQVTTPPLADPTTLFILFTLGAACLYIELAHPGALVPGAIGLFAMALFIVSAAALQPNWAGFALMLLAIALLALDARVTTHGVLTTVALAALVVGALIFFGPSTNQPGLDPWALAGAVGGLGAISLLTLTYAIRARRLPVTNGREGLIGQEARVIEPLDPTGRVRLHGENWAARLDPPEGSMPVGETVAILGLDHLTLLVAPAPESGAPHPSLQALKEATL